MTMMNGISDRNSNGEVVVEWLISSIVSRGDLPMRTIIFGVLNESSRTR